MGDAQTTKAAETTRVKQKTEDRPPPERENASRAFAEATLFRAAASDDPTTPPQHLRHIWGQACIEIMLKKSFSENQTKIFRTQMPYNERSDIG